ncbi:hypothetical protein [Arthrobacter rhombi]|uniref:hypothetical protein n=1 Tax=Arthrobacter rhombi TaxID=71253 RepID=UPI003FCFA03A
MYNPASHLSNTLRRAAADGLTMPASLTAHWAEVDALAEDLRAAEAVRPMDAAIASARDRKLTDKVLTPVGLRQFRIDATDAAKGNAEREFSGILEGVRDELIDTIKTERYAPAIAKLEALAEKIEPEDSVDYLVRRRRPDDAAALVAAEAAAREVRSAHELVRDLDRGRSLNNLRAVYRDASAAKDAVAYGSEWTVKSQLGAIKAGARPWLPTRDEFRGVQASIEAEREAARLRGHNSLGPAPHFFSAMR